MYDTYMSTPGNTAKLGTAQFDADSKTVLVFSSIDNF